MDIQLPFILVSAVYIGFCQALRMYMHLYFLLLLQHCVWIMYYNNPVSFKSDRIHLRPTFWDSSSVFTEGDLMLQHVRVYYIPETMTSFEFLRMISQNFHKVYPLFSKCIYWYSVLADQSAGWGLLFSEIRSVVVFIL